MANDDQNEDWIKARSWDVRNGPELVTTLDDKDMHDVTAYLALLK